MHLIHLCLLILSLRSVNAKQKPKTDAEFAAEKRLSAVNRKPVVVVSRRDGTERTTPIRTHSLFARESFDQSPSDVFTLRRGVVSIFLEGFVLADQISSTCSSTFSITLGLVG